MGNFGAKNSFRTKITYQTEIHLKHCMIFPSGWYLLWWLRSSFYFQNANIEGHTWATWEKMTHLQYAFLCFLTISYAKHYHINTTLIKLLNS